MAMTGNKEYEEDPSRFDTIPIPFTNVTLQVRAFYSVREGSGAPALKAGDDVKVRVPLQPRFGHPDGRGSSGA